MIDDHIILTDSELLALTGYKRPAEQLRSLLRMGFYRARLSRIGKVVLERDHYQAVCQGAIAMVGAQAKRPQVRV